VYASAGTGVNHLDESYDGRTPDIPDNAFVLADFASGAGSLHVRRGREMAEPHLGCRRLRPHRRSHADARSFRSQRPGTRLATGDHVPEEPETHPGNLPVEAALPAAGDRRGAAFRQRRRFRDPVPGRSSAPEVALEDGLWPVMIGEAPETGAREARPVEFGS